MSKFFSKDRAKAYDEILAKLYDRLNEVKVNIEWQRDMTDDYTPELYQEHDFLSTLIHQMECS